MNIGFLAKATDAGNALQALETDIDRFHLQGREVYWRCLLRQSQSKVSGGSIERAMGARMTMRGLNTVQRLAAKGRCACHGSSVYIPAPPRPPDTSSRAPVVKLLAAVAK